jgi:hypothetical protein
MKDLSHPIMSRITHTRRSSTPIRSNTVRSLCSSSSTNGRAVAPTSLTRATQRLRPQTMDLHGSNILFPAMRRAHRRFPMRYLHVPHPPTPSRSQDRDLHQVIIAKMYRHLPADFTQAQSWMARLHTPMQATTYVGNSVCRQGSLSAWLPSTIHRQARSPANRCPLWSSLQFMVAPEKGLLSKRFIKQLSKDLNGIVIPGISPGRCVIPSWKKKIHY